MLQTDLTLYNKNKYKPGSIIKRMAWYVVNELFLRNPLNLSSRIKIFWLRLFGAEIGIGVTLKPRISIKYPWKLKIASHCWIGEGVWIDNLDMVTIENHVCISQGVLLICGNHNYKRKGFDLMTAPIVLKQGCWVGAKSVLGPGVIIGNHAVLALGSVCSSNLEPYTIYRGNPCIKVANRVICE